MEAVHQDNPHEGQWYGGGPPMQSAPSSSSASEHPTSTKDAALSKEWDLEGWHPGQLWDAEWKPVSGTEDDKEYKIPRTEGYEEYKIPAPHGFGRQHEHFRARASGGSTGDKPPRYGNRGGKNCANTAWFTSLAKAQRKVDNGSDPMAVINFKKNNVKPLNKEQRELKKLEEAAVN